MRVALPNARIMIHQPSGGARGMASDVEIQAREILRIKKRMNDLYVKYTGKKLSELVAGMPKYPQTLLNVRTDKKLDPTKTPAIQEAVTAVEDELRETGRVVLRASGTEPVIRVMVEGEDAAEVETLAGQIAEVIKSAA